jgi:hypothetical protein
VLHVCADYVTLRERGTAFDSAIERMASQPLEYDVTLVETLRVVARG